MPNNIIVDLLQMILPSMSAGLASTLSYVITFLIGLMVGVPTVAVWVRQKFPKIIAFLAYVYDQTAKAEKEVTTDTSGVSVPVTGAVKKTLVMANLTKELLNPENEIITEKNIKLFKKLSGIAGTLGNVIEFIVPIMKRIRWKRK